MKKEWGQVKVKSKEGKRRDWQGNKVMKKNKKGAEGGGGGERNSKNLFSASFVLLFPSSFLFSLSLV